jgi:hypothetical protein
MRTVATTLKDIGDQLSFDIAGLKPVVAAYLTLQLEPLRVHAWALLDRRDRDAEAALARSELRLTESFGAINFDFTTVHLQGRDPGQFIPAYAYPVKIADRDVEKHFAESFRARVHAG